MPYLGLSSVYPKVFIASLHRSAVTFEKFGLSWRALSEMRKVSDQKIFCLSEASSMLVQAERRAMLA